MQRANIRWWLVAGVVAVIAVAASWRSASVAARPRREEKSPSRFGFMATVGVALLAVVVVRNTVGSATGLWFAGLVCLFAPVGLYSFILLHPSDAK